VAAPVSTVRPHAGVLVIVASLRGDSVVSREGLEPSTP
jgi:hypothetical protein